MQTPIQQALKVLTEAVGEAEAPKTPAATEPEQLISSGKLALTFGVSYKTVGNWRSAGCPCTPINGTGGAVRGYRYSLSEVRAWLSSRNRGPSVDAVMTGVSR